MTDDEQAQAPDHTAADRRIGELEKQLRDTQLALHRLLFVLGETGLMTSDSVEVVRELLPQVYVASLAGQETPSHPAARRRAPRTRDRAPRATIEDLTPEQQQRRRSAIGRMSANTRWAKEPDRYAATQAARDGMAKKFEDQVDPDRILPIEERARRAASARTAHFQRLALKSAQARRARKGGGA